MNNTLKLIFTRFIFLLCITFILCFNNGAYFFLYYLTRFTDPLLHTFIPWFAARILRLPEKITIFTNGSGDTTYDYVTLLFVIITSFFGTLIWSVLDRKRKSHDQLFYWLIVALRFYVGFMLVQYGLAKLNNGQFPSPSGYGLISTYGDSTPMGLAWRFLGFSDGYKTFMFFAEMMGVLLFFRKTATIGAFLCLMTSMNIMAINYFFDVPVKILSTALVVMCLIILSSNIVRLFKLFFMGEMVKLDLLKAPVFTKKWVRITVIVAKYAMILICAAVPFFNTLQITFTAKPDEKLPLYGAYDISSINWPKGNPDPDSSFAQDKWKVMGFSSYDRSFVKLDNGSTIFGKAEIDFPKKTVKLSFADEPGVRYTLNYRIVKDHMTLKGELFNKPVVISLEKKEFELTKGGFKWVNEYPNNR